MQPALGTSAPTCASLEGSTARLDAYGDLGGFHHSVVTSSADAQRLFDQGLLLAYNFNQYEAARSFQAATEADPECAMCWWGSAYAAGPFANKSAAPVPPDLSYPVFTPQELETARAALQRADEALHSEGYQRVLASKGGATGSHVLGGGAHTSQGPPHGAHGTPNLGRATPGVGEGEALVGWSEARDMGEQEQRYIAAMRERYSGGTEGPAWEAAERGYAATMERIGRPGGQGGGDADALALAAEAMMNLTAWDFGLGGGHPNEEAQEAQRLIRGALGVDPSHPLAAHLFIHLTEIVPGRGQGGSGQAEPYANMLPPSYPTMNHLVHMAAHNYLRVGRWHDAVVVSRAAVAVDRADAARCLVPYSPQHNLSMLLYAASMGGELQEAERGARELRGLEGVPGREILADEGRDWAALSLLWARYGQWQAIAQDDQTPRADDLGGEYQEVMRRYVRLLAESAEAAGKVQSGVEQVAGASQAVTKQVVELAEAAEQLPDDSPTKPGVGLGIYSGGWKVRARTAAEVGRARVAVLSGSWEEAEDALSKAVALEESVGYFEPPRQYQPMRQCLGWVLLQHGRLQEAVQVYQADLQDNPDNPWALTGLYEAYTAGATASAAAGDAAVAGEMSRLAADTEAQLQEAWRSADVGLKLLSSCPTFSQSR